MSTDGGSGRRLLLPAVAVASLVLWAALVAPLLGGAETLYFRDVFHSHLPFKAFGAAALAEGRVPAFQPTWALGQPFRGNPNTAAFYPGNLAYLALPFWTAFNLHYGLHWLLAAISMFVLARALRASRAGALLAALGYAGSGWMLSVMTFYNILAVVAWWPLVIAGVVRGDRRGLIFGGLACGLALLGGEPVTAALGLAPLVVLAWRELGLFRAVTRTALVGLAGCLVALPQLVATLRVVGFSFRATHGVLASQATYYSLEPRRLLELVLPFPFGLPGHVGPAGMGAGGLLDHLPFYYSLYPGVVVTLLAAIAVGRRRVLAGLVGAGLVLAWLGGFSSAALLDLGGGLLRSPEKLLFWVALGLPLLAAAGLDSLSSAASGRRFGVVALAGAGVAAAVAAALAATGGGTPLAALALADRGPSPEAVAAHGALWLLGLGAAALLLAGSWLAAKTGRPEILVALQLVSALQLAPLWMTDEVERYERVSWRDRVEPGEAAVVARMGYPPWPSSAPSPVLPAGPPVGTVRLEAEEMSPAPGVRHGLLYPVAPDLDGMHHLFYNFLTVRMASADWSQRRRWAEVLGTDYLVSPEPLAGAGRPAVLEHYGVSAYLYRLDDAPPAWWPERVEVASSPGAAFDRVAASAPGSLPAVAPEPVSHRPGGRVELIAAEPDRLVLEVESEGGLAVVQRSYQALFRARAGSLELPTLPVNLCLLGVVVPPGRHRVTIEVDATPEVVASVVAVVFALLLLAALWLESRAVPLTIE